MLDPYIRPLINQPLNQLAEKIAGAGISPNVITIAGFLIGILGCFAVGYQSYTLGLILILLNRLMDGLDGAVARVSKKESDFGGYLDIVLDMIFYAAFVFFFALGQPTHHLAAAFLLFAYMGTSSSFLAYAIMAAKRGESTEKRGKKSFYHLGGLCEGTETTIFMVLCCLYAEGFAAFCAIFGVLCWLTTAGRIWDVRKNVMESSPPEKDTN